MTRTTLFTILFLTSSGAYAAPDLADAQTRDDQRTIVAPGPSLPEWADTQLPDRSGSADASVSRFSPPDPPGTPNPVPLDGGLGLLALAGAGYAARKLRK